MNGYAGWLRVTGATPWARASAQLTRPFRLSSHAAITSGTGAAVVGTAPRANVINSVEAQPASTWSSASASRWSMVSPPRGRAAPERDVDVARASGGVGRAGSVHCGGRGTGGIGKDGVPVLEGEVGGDQQGAVLVAAAAALATPAPARPPRGTGCRAPRSCRARRCRPRSGPGRGARASRPSATARTARRSAPNTTAAGTRSARPRARTPSASCPHGRPWGSPRLPIGRMLSVR